MNDLANPNRWPFWCELTERCWELFWLAARAFVLGAVIPAGVLFGLRLIGAIIPKVSP